MDLNDLYKLAGIQQSNTPAIEPQPVEQVAEQPMDGRENMKAMIALITPQQLNQLVGDAPMAEEMPGEATTEPNPQEYKGPLGSPADLSLRRYLGAKGMPVSMEEAETNVYADHKVEDVNEAWQAYKADPVVEVKTELEEEPNEGNEFSGELEKARKAGKKEFKVGDKTYKVESEETSRLKKLAGTQQVDEAPGDDMPADYDYSEPYIVKGDKYDPNNAQAGMYNTNSRKPAQWKQDTPSQLMMVIKKYNLDPNDAEQMADEEMNADIDAIADLHDKYLDRIAKEGKIKPDENGQFLLSDEEDDLHDIDGGEEWLDSPEYDKVMTMVGDLCSAMGMEDAGREECGNGLMKYIDGGTQESAEINDLRKRAGIDEAPGDDMPADYDYSEPWIVKGDKYDPDNAQAGMYNTDGRKGPQWKAGIPNQLMAVIKKSNITPDDAWQMANRDMNADIDVIAELHDEFVDRTGSDSDIDSGNEWLASPEYAKVMTMIGELCSAMGMEDGGREECGQALMKYVDEGATAESEELSILKRNAGI